MDVFVPEGLMMTKSEKKKLEKLNKFNFDLQGIHLVHLHIILFSHLFNLIEKSFFVKIQLKRLKKNIKWL